SSISALAALRAAEGGWRSGATQRLPCRYPATQAPLADGDPSHSVPLNRRPAGQPPGAALRSYPLSVASRLALALSIALRVSVGRSTRAISLSVSPRAPDSTMAMAVPIEWGENTMLPGLAANVVNRS